MFVLCFFAVEFLMFWGMVFLRFHTISDPKMDAKTSVRRSSRVRPPSPIFLHTCESNLRKTHKCGFKGLLDFKLSPRFSYIIISIAQVKPTSVL